MVSLEQAKAIFADMIKQSGEPFEVEQVQEIQLEEPLYVMIALDEKGEQIFPGERFPSIRKADGALIDYSFPCPA